MCFRISCSLAVHPVRNISQDCTARAAKGHGRNLCTASGEGWMGMSWGQSIVIWLVVWVLFYFLIYWEKSSQLTNIFPRG